MHKSILGSKGRYFLLAALFASVASALVLADFLFLPMFRQLPRVRDEPNAVACPVAQASPDLLRHDLGAIAPRLLAPSIEIANPTFSLPTIPATSGMEAA